MIDVTSKFRDFSRIISDAGSHIQYSYTKLSESQIASFESRGSFCRDWSRIQISAETDISLIRGCVFAGDVHIHLPGGELSGTRIEDTIINGPLEVISNGLIKGFTLQPECSVKYCGSIVWTGSPGFIRRSIKGGLETGERDIPIFPNLSHTEAVWLAGPRGREEAERISRLLRELDSSLKGLIGSGSKVESCPVVENSIILNEVLVSGASAVRGSLIMPGSKVTDGALVRNSVLQWNATVDSMAVVQDSITGEFSTVEKHGKLSQSFLGADSVLGEGEVTASIVGPLTGIHHQSLLIAASWPGGRGNVGYGANIGSNHTSRLPDQEIRPGTGLFFGLSTSVKFPADFSRSPYSVIATGITTLPQRVEFPFSLICLPRSRPPDIPEGWCRLVPGWMLHSNLYSILRSLWKFESRSRAVHTPVETQVFTEDVLEMVKDALRRLETTPDNAVEGAGKNFITAEDRLAGIQVYRKCLRIFALIEILNAGSMNPGEAGELLDLAAHVKRLAWESREKDASRGIRIIDDYAAVHPDKEEDPVLILLDEKSAALGRTLKEIQGTPSK